jgi:hypothetical protein
VTPADRANLRQVFDPGKECGDREWCGTDNERMVIAALDDLDRLERGLGAINERTTDEDTLRPYHGGPSLWEVVERLLAGREWNDDGTAPNGGTDG